MVFSGSVLPEMDQIHLGYAEQLKAGGLDVTSRRLDGEAHFLLFPQRAEVLKLVAAWLGRTTNAATPSR